MNRVFRTLLLWLLIAALPVQGWAAVVKSGCGSAHHDLPPVVAMADSHDVSPAQSHHDGMSGHATADANAVKAGVENGSAHKSSYCSACAASCFGAAAPPPALSFPPSVSSSETVVVPLLPLLAGQVPASLERPPRHIFL